MEQSYIISLTGDKPTTVATIVTDSKDRALTLAKLLLANRKWSTITILHNARQITLQELEAL